METRNQIESALARLLPDTRRHPRFKLSIEIKVYSRTCGLISGRTVDISESGISAMFRIEIPVGEVVRLQFTLPLGSVEVQAVVRQRNAFQYGFEFLEASNAPELDIVRRTCRDLAVEESFLGSEPH